MSNPFTGRALTTEAPVASSPRRILRGSAQQESLWAALTDTDTHVLVEARAGTGKSSSCREGMHRMLERRPKLAGAIRYAVFNSQNAREFAADCPAGVEAATVHHFGYQALQKAYRSKLEKNKSYLILDESAEGRRMPRYLRRSIAQLVGAAKNANLQPDDHEVIREAMHDLIIHYEINAWGRTSWLIMAAIDVLRRAFEWTELIDFDDMLWLPVQHALAFPEIDTLFADEVQDWNPCQHALLPLLCASGRVGAVGDRFQSIYAFRGADVGSIPRLQQQLAGDGRGLECLPLTISWRCPRSHIAMAQQIVPDIEAAPAATEGDISRMPLEQALVSCSPGDMVICALNAPLISAGLQLISQGRRAIIRGRAVGDQLLNVIAQSGSWDTVTELTRNVQRWASKELLRLSDLDDAEDLIEVVQDRVAGLSAVLSRCTDAHEVEPTIRALFSDDAAPGRTPGAVVFSTIHRAKGLEADTVRILEAKTRPPQQEWQLWQARNLRYVALTRSKNHLSFVSISE